MPDVVHEAKDMISGMEPVALPGTFVFVSTNDPSLVERLTPEAVSIFKEREGMSLLVPVELARSLDQNIESPMRCITLNVYSSLDGVGLTAAVSNALADHSIPCNMVAACHHDHVFVPADRCNQAMDILMSLQSKASES